MKSTMTTMVAKIEHSITSLIACHEVISAQEIACRLIK